MRHGPRILQMVNTVIGIDLGTQALKVLFLDANGGGLVADATAPLALYRTDNGVAEQEHQWWLSALSEAMGGIDPEIRRTARAMAVSGQQHGFVAVDRSDRVLAPVKLWCDTSTQAQAEQIEEAFGVEAAGAADHDEHGADHDDGAHGDDADEGHGEDGSAEEIGRAHV